MAYGAEIRAVERQNAISRAPGQDGVARDRISPTPHEKALANNHPQIIEACGKTGLFFDEETPNIHIRSLVSSGCESLASQPNWNVWGYFLTCRQGFVVYCAHLIISHGATDNGF